MSRFIRFSLLLMAGALITHWAEAANYFGRISTGGFYSNENYGDNSAGLLNDNYAVYSNRFYFTATGIDNKNLDFNADLRDKNDFFDNANQNNLTLTPVNKFQSYQLNFKLQDPETGWYYTAGRFSLSDAGGDFTDGAEAGYHWNQVWRSGAFGGLNPRTSDQTYVGFNTDSYDFGAYTTYQPTGFASNQNLFWTNAFVGDLYSSQFQRIYWYNNLVFQWDTPSQIIAMAYLDFVPVVYIQSALLSWHEQIAKDWESTTSLTSVDVIQYQRQQNVLERLPSSPYREGAFNLRHNLDDMNVDANVIYGKRQLDSMSKVEGSMGPSFPKLMDSHVNASGLLGARKNFDSNDEFVQLMGGYYSRDWELDLRVNYALSAQTGGYVLHQWLNELTLERYFSRNWMVNAVLEQGKDEIVTVLSGLLKVTYTFGERDTSPIRETAPVPLPPPPEGRIY